MQLMYHHQEITENTVSKGLRFITQGEPLDMRCRFGRPGRVLSSANGPVHLDCSVPPARIISVWFRGSIARPRGVLTMRGLSAKGMAGLRIVSSGSGIGDSQRTHDSRRRGRAGD